MKNLTLLIIFTFVVTFAHSQDYNKFRLSDKQKKQLVRDGNTHILVIEQFLDKNEEYLEENELLTDSRSLTNLLDPTPYINKTKGIKVKNICSDCYLEEYSTQLSKQNTISQRIKRHEDQKRREKDSIYQAEKNRIENIRKTDQLKKDSLSKANQHRSQYISKSNPYDNFIMSMEMAGKDKIGHRYFTVFCDIDLDLASNRLGLYLQDNGLTYADDDYKDTGKKITYKFIPKISTKNESINITYTYNENKALLSYVTATTGSYSPCYQIQSVEIIGTKDIVLSLYLSYWGLHNLKIGGYKGNETSYNEYMGDYIAYTPINNRTSKITITKREGIEMNYYKNFKIE